MAIGTTVKVGWDATKVQRGMTSLKARFGRFATNVAGKLKTGMTAAAVAITATFAAATAATVAYFNKFRKEMDRIGKLAKRFEVPVEDLQRLQIAAELSGTNIEVLAKALQTLTRYAVKAGQEGGATYARAFEELRINAQKFAGMRPEQQILELSRAYNEGGKSAEKFAAILEVMGARSGGELMPLLRETPERLRGIFSQVNTVSGETIRKMEQFNDRITIIKQNLRVAFSQAIAGDMDAIKAALALVRSVLRDAWEGVGKDIALTTAARLVDGVNKFFKWLKDHPVAAAVAFPGIGGPAGVNLLEQTSRKGARDLRAARGDFSFEPSQLTLERERIYQAALRGTKEGVKEGMQNIVLEGPNVPVGGRWEDMRAKWSR